ncbi:MAG TPA: DNA-deoxyinosine glycosylase [Bacillota bacterium]|jgi:TDG/mug DNA glycosylase family protein|nr:DNA-deoxyinosine glycosylase [Bacillota bacterium]
MKTSMASERFVHPVEPLFNENSRVLILGTFPSPKSREGKFFYHHPQNRFWKVMAALTGPPAPETIEEKKELILSNGFAVWDVVKSCRVTGASDSSIKDVVPTDLSIILDHAPIEKIYANGGTAYKLYMKYSYPKTGRPIEKLPSTSPANAAWSLERLIEAWSVILESRR